MNKSYRIQHRFWLDVVKDEELQLAEQLQNQKKKRQYTATIRNALKLFFSLSKGDTSVLLDMFPFVEEKLSSPGDSGNDTPPDGEIIKKIDELQKQIIDMKVGQGSPNGLLMEARKEVSLPMIEDEPVIEIKKDTSTNSGQNLLNSLAAFG